MRLYYENVLFGCERTLLPKLLHQMFEKFFDYFFELSLPESGILVNQDNFMHAEHVLSPNCLGQQGKPLIY
jgi:hypothetical protein